MGSRASWAVVIRSSCSGGSCCWLSPATGGRKRRGVDNEVVYVSKAEMDSLVEDLDSIQELQTELKGGKEEEKEDTEAEKQRKALEDQKKTKPKQYGLEPPRFDQWMAMHSPYMQSMLKEGNYFGYDLNRAQGNNIWQGVGGVLFSGMPYVTLPPMVKKVPEVKKVPVVNKVPLVKKPLGYNGRNKRSTDYGYGGYNAGYGHYQAYGYGGYPAYGYGGYSGYGPYYGYGGYGPYNYYGDNGH